jgi:NADH-quinone oxidoreductase subunit L
MTMLQHAILILILPLASATVIALFLRKQGALASWVSTATAGAIAAISIILLLHGERNFPDSSWEWLRFGDFAVSLGIKYDDLAALMLFIVGFVGFLIHVFSLGYMHDDAARARFFGGLSIFMFSMIGIVLADNLFMIFIFWELVGFSSWLLINHYHEKQSAADASKKAFIVNRVGDFGFLLGIIWCYYCFGTVNLSEMSNMMEGGVMVCSKWIPLLLFCGAVGKSAQMPLQVWLPDAMDPVPHGGGSAHGHHVDRHDHRGLRRALCDRPARHQEGAGLLDAFSTRLHGRGVWARKFKNPDLPAWIASSWPS